MKPDSPVWTVLYALEPHDYLDDQVCGHVCSYQYCTLQTEGLMCGLTKREHAILKRGA